MEAKVKQKKNHFEEKALSWKQRLSGCLYKYTTTHTLKKRRRKKKVWKQ